MSLDHFLIHTCTIRRSADADPAQDAYGAESKAWSDDQTSVPCRFVEDAERVASESRGELITSTYRLVVRSGTDVLNADRITDIALDDGTTDTDTYEVKAVLKRRSRREHHITLELQKVE